MKFEWDETKRAENLRKHAVDFSDAVGVFYDENALTREDPDAASETRFITIGMDFEIRVLLVVWTERGAETYRIISARKATKSEASQYGE